MDLSSCTFLEKLPIYRDFERYMPVSDTSLCNTFSDSCEASVTSSDSSGEAMNRKKESQASFWIAVWMVKRATLMISDIILHTIYESTSASSPRSMSVIASEVMMLMSTETKAKMILVATRFRKSV